jgi:hypothetical protein
MRHPELTKRDADSEQEPSAVSEAAGDPMADRQPERDLSTFWTMLDGDAPREKPACL